MILYHDPIIPYHHPMISNILHSLVSQLMLLLDMFRLVSVHIVLIHRVLTMLHSLLFRLIMSLWLLFRGPPAYTAHNCIPSVLSSHDPVSSYPGKKKNILRSRIDSCNYDRKQLLFGTVLFSILLFLYPTFAVYYSLFTILHCLIALLQGLIWSIAIGKS